MIYPKNVVVHSELLQSALWLLLLTAEAATRVLDRASELEGFYIALMEMMVLGMRLLRALKLRKK